MKQKLKLLVILLLIASFFMSVLFMKTSQAAFEVDKANLYSKGDCGSLLKKDGSIIHVTYVVYQKNGKEYPAYCLDKTKPGVGEVGSYTVSLEETLKNAKVWRALISGFPYKTPEQLGCQTEKEAFTATKMAVYSMLYDYSITQFSAIGEAGQRTLEALDTILKNAQNSSASQLSSALTVKQVSTEWKVDELNHQYIYQLYQVVADAPIQSYTVAMNKENLEDAKIVDVNNNERTEFKEKETFKILLPISQLGNGGELSIQVKGKVETKPIVIGKSPIPSQQDYAITGMIWEEGNGNKTIYYSKNQTKLKILKKDQQQSIPLPGAYFELYNAKKEKIRENLVSNENGEILLENLLPGTYYLKETKAPDGYLCYEEEMELVIGFNEELTLIVNNKKEEKPTIEITKTKKEVKQEKVQPKLPKTGM